jgi:hypothetical protein
MPVRPDRAEAELMAGHVPNVRHVLGRTTADDSYIPVCSCPWSGRPIKAGLTPTQNWDRAWRRADRHVTEAEEADRARANP